MHVMHTLAMCNCTYGSCVGVATCIAWAVHAARRGHSNCVKYKAQRVTSAVSFPTQQSRLVSQPSKTQSTLAVWPVMGVQQQLPAAAAVHSAAAKAECGVVAAAPGAGAVPSAVAAAVPWQLASHQKFQRLPLVPACLTCVYTLCWAKERHPASGGRVRHVQCAKCYDTVLLRSSCSCCRALQPACHPPMLQLLNLESG